MVSQLLVRQVALARSRHILFHDLNLSLSSGELLHVLGANGVGKSSLLAAIAGILPLQCGSITNGGGAAFDPNEIAYLGHRLGLKASLTAQQNLAYYWPDHSEEQLLMMMSAFQLISVKNQPLTQLSAGQRQRLALLNVLLSSSTLWLLDEPFVCLDLAMQNRLQSHIQQHLSDGGMVIFTSHQQQAWLDGIQPRTIHLEPFEFPDSNMEAECLDSSII